MALKCLKGGTECGNNYVKKGIYSAPAVKGLFTNLSYIIHQTIIYEPEAQTT